MPLRSWIVLALGVVIAVGTALSLRSRLNTSADAPALTQVLIASTDIPAGSFVRDTQLSFVDWPKDNITPLMLTNATTKQNDFNGAVARRTIQKGEPIQKSLLVKANEGGFMSAVLEPGKRAVSIAVDPTSGNAGFIFPGDHVDLILTHVINKNSSVSSRASETFIEDARVLAVDQSLDNPENKAVLAKTVTLEVTPKQAEEINLAKDLGKISLSLRSLARKPVTAAAVTKAPDEVRTLDDILKAHTPPSAATPDTPIENVTRDTEVSKIITPENSEGSRVQLIRGSERTEIIFGSPTTEAPRAK